MNLKSSLRFQPFLSTGFFCSVFSFLAKVFFSLILLEFIQFFTFWTASKFCIWLENSVHLTRFLLIMSSTAFSIFVFIRTSVFWLYNIRPDALTKTNKISDSTLNDFIFLSLNNFDLIRRFDILDLFTTNIYRIFI